jgi:hypothetical protein
VKIHQLEAEKVWESTLDPRTGRIVRRGSEQIGPGAATGFVAEDGTEYRRDPDGTFEVPGEVAAFKMREPGWQAGPNPFAEQIEAEHAQAEKEAKAELAAQKREAKAAK